MKKPERSKLTGGFKNLKNTSVIPSPSVILSPSSVTLSEAKSLRINSAKDLKKAARVLKAGGIVIFPTDTVYGIGCRFDDQRAIARLYQIKGTPRNQPLPILVSKTSQVNSLATITKIGKKLISKYWPGGLTIALPGLSTYSKPGSEQLCESGLNAEKTEKIGFRMPNSKLVLVLINQIGVPIIGTSANFHGQEPSKSFAELDPNLIKLADFVIKGKCQTGIESTVVDATVDPPRILRQGAVKLMSLNPVIPALQLSFPRNRESIQDKLA